MCFFFKSYFFLQVFFFLEGRRGSGWFLNISSFIILHTDMTRIAVVFSEDCISR